MCRRIQRKNDAVFVFVNLKGYAQENIVRLRYSTGHSDEIPWFVMEVSTVCISLNYTTHLIDLPMMKTYINAYANTRIVVKAVKKIRGDSEFKGTHKQEGGSKLIGPPFSFWGISTKKLFLICK